MNEGMNQFPSPKDTARMVDAVQPKEKINQDEILNQKYQEILDGFKDVDDIDDEISKCVEHGAEYSGHCEYYSSRVINEIEAACRHALSMGADYIICLDKSARNYGVIFHLVLPAIKLEYCRLKNKNIENIKVPEIKFINPRRGGKFTESQADQFKSAFGNIFENKNILVFDESASHTLEGEADNWFMEYLGNVPVDAVRDLEGGFPEPKKQYDLYKTLRESVDTYFHKLDFSKLERTKSTGRSVATSIKNTINVNKIDSHIGLSDMRGGNLSKLLKILHPDIPQNITSDINKETDSYDDNDSIFAKKSDETNSEEIIELRQSLKKIAKKIVEDVYEKSFEKKN